jgi:hypothetical protein
MIVRGCGCLLVFVLLLAASGVSISLAFLPPLDADAALDAQPTPVVDGPVRGPLPGFIVYVDTPELNLRAAPGTDQDVVAVLPERMAVRTLGHGERVGDTIWIDVHVPDLGLDGWVAKPYLSILQKYRAPY